MIAINVKRLAGTALSQSSLKIVSEQHDLNETSRARGDVWTVRRDGLALANEAEADDADRGSACIYQHCRSARRSYHRLCLFSMFFCLVFKRERKFARFPGLYIQL